MTNDLSYNSPLRAKMLNARERWDQYFYDIAHVVAQKSNCGSRKIGAIIVSSDSSIVSTGYNGPPRGVRPCSVRYDDPWYTDPLFKYPVPSEDLKDMIAAGTLCPRRALKIPSGQGLDLCTAAHAETNAIVNAAREGVRTKGSRMFLTCGVPCKECMKLIINAGIEEVVLTDLVAYDELALPMAQDAGLLLRTYDLT